MEGIAPYMHKPFERMNVGDGLWTSRGINQRFRFRLRLKGAPHLQFHTPFPTQINRMNSIDLK